MTTEDAEDFKYAVVAVIFIVYTSEAVIVTYN
jgi:hypothetical protein